MNRRDWFQLSGLAVGSQFASVRAAEPLEPLNRFPRSVQEWTVAQVRAGERFIVGMQSHIKSKADAEKHIQNSKRTIGQCFGPLPEKTPLNAKITGALNRDSYTIEKIIFESRPGFLVTANLYLPKGAKEPRPAVIGSCGHSTTGKAEPAYQSFAQGLARMGYVVMIYDPIGQGERLQYGHLTGKGGPRVGVGEHLLAGNQQFLIGEFFGTWRAWDGIRALDYLLSRPEVDPKHVGITGNSGGGTLTTWLCGLDDRWTMAAPGCFITTFRRNAENELPADTEQCPPNVLARGIDHADFLSALAPKPVIVLAKEKDFFDVRGAEEAFRRLKSIYAALDAEENVKLHVGPTGHGYTIENREAMYAWFNKATGLSKETREPKLAIETEEALRCSTTGQVADLKSRTVFSFTKEKSERLAAKRAPLKPDELRSWIVGLLEIPKRDGVPEYRILRAANNRKYPKPHATSYAIETEPPAVAVAYRLGDEALYSRPPKSDSPVILYVSHNSADAELRDEPLIPDLMKAKPNAAMFACDVRGVGESRPDTCGGASQYLTPYGSDYFYAIHGIMLRRPYPGQKTLDLLRVIDWLASFGHKSIHLVAKGWGTIPATFAAVLHDAVTQVTLKQGLKSYREVAETELYTWPLSSFAPNALGCFDLPDCYDLLKAKKKLKQL